MYILKNALKSISRAKGRNVLIGIIVLVISVAACIGLSIQNAAEDAREATLGGITITAQISVDRNAMMSGMKENMQPGEDGGMPSFDKDSFRENMNAIEELTIDEMQKYADLDMVKSFYYTMSVSMNGSELEAVSTTTSDDEEETDNAENSNPNTQGMQGFGGAGMGMSENKGGKGFRPGSMGQQGDFTLVGYSSDEAMEGFLDGTCTIVDGNVFEEGTKEYHCIITDELATYNDISVGDTIKITNPNDEEEVYELQVVGTYNNAQSTVTSGGFMQGFSTSSDAANQIYLSYNALSAIVSTSSENAEETTDENTGITRTTALPEQTSGTYVFATVEDYEKFSTDVYEAGLSEDYTVSSSDVTQYENSLLPLKNLSQMSMYFLIVVFAIGGIILVVLNIFNVRERKYEVGVLTAIGMKKRKVAFQFILETLIVTIAFVVIGGGIGAVTSVPVTNSLLASQIEAQESQMKNDGEAFGRDANFDRGSMPGNMGGGMPGNMSDMEERPGFVGGAANYVQEVSSATDLGVLLKLLGIGVLLALIASAASVIFITRYDPLKILANRD